LKKLGLSLVSLGDYHIVQERAFDFLDAPIQRITTATPAPYSPVLLKEWLPNADDVIKAVKKSYV
jgi:pyruvate dehydrogenase E1 component beta subunit